MHECGALKSLPRRLLGHLRCRQPAELLIDERQQFFRGPGVALLGPVENAGDVAHGAEHSLESGCRETANALA
jgi:hypothetical protein